MPKLGNRYVGYWLDRMRNRLMMEDFRLYLQSQPLKFPLLYASLSVAPSGPLRLGSFDFYVTLEPNRTGIAYRVEIAEVHPLFRDTICSSQLTRFPGTSLVRGKLHPSSRVLRWYCNSNTRSAAIIAFKQGCKEFTVLERSFVLWAKTREAQRLQDLAAQAKRSFEEDSN